MSATDSTQFDFVDIPAASRQKFLECEVRAREKYGPTAVVRLWRTEAGYQAGVFLDGQPSPYPLC